MFNVYLSLLPAFSSINVLKLAMDRTPLTRNLELLETRKLAQQQPEQNRRNRLWSLTAKGEPVLKEGLPRRESAQAAIQEQLGTSGPLALTDAVGNVVNTLSSVY
jgi:DNA-binding MarR family transcriptional regulator